MVKENKYICKRPYSCPNRVIGHKRYKFAFVDVEVYNECLEQIKSVSDVVAPNHDKISKQIIINRLSNNYYRTVESFGTDLLSFAKQLASIEQDDDSTRV